jgi:hypothetical protein
MKFVCQIWTKIAFLRTFSSLGHFSIISQIVTLNSAVGVNIMSHRVAWPQNVGVAVGISLLSYIQAEIYVIAYVLLVNGGHLLFTSHPTSSPNMSKYVAVSVGNLVISRSNYDILFMSARLRWLKRQLLQLCCRDPWFKSRYRQLDSGFHPFEFGKLSRNV